MRTSIVAIAVVLSGAIAPASADPRILTVQDQVQEQVQDQVQVPERAPAPAQDQPAANGREDAPAQAPAPAPAQTQNQADSPSATGRADERAQRQDSAPANVPSRYSFQRVEDGFLRLDNVSGHIAFCSPHTVGWVCQAVPEDRTALEKEIARLQSEVVSLQDKVAGLKEEVARLREPPPPPRPPGDLTPPSDKGGGLKMPSDEDMARARTAIADAWQRLMDMLAQLQKEMLRKTPPPDRTTL